MGCSASRPDTLLFTKSNNNSPDEDPYSLEYSMVSNSPPVPRALSLPTPLVHHPPLRKGDTHHLVSLTSTAYGSLFLIDNTKPPDLNHQQKNQSLVVHHHVDPEDSLSPDSVINTWELMDGLDDDDDDFDLGKPNSLSSKSNTLISFKGTLEDCKPAVKPSLTKPLWKHLSEERPSLSRLGLEFS